MRIASYNQMFGCDGQSLVEFGIVHGLHKLKAYEAVERRARLERTVETIRQAAAEIQGMPSLLLRALAKVVFPHFGGPPMR